MWLAKGTSASLCVTKLSTPDTMTAETAAVRWVVVLPSSISLSAAWTFAFRVLRFFQHFRGSHLVFHLLLVARGPPCADVHVVFVGWTTRIRTPAPPCFRRFPSTFGFERDRNRWKPRCRPERTRVQNQGSLSSKGDRGRLQPHSGTHGFLGGMRYL